MKSIEAVGKNVEEAIQQGLKALNLSKTDVDIKIISKGGWFSKAKVLITQSSENIQNVEKEQKNTQKSVKNEEILANSVQNAVKTKNILDEQIVVEDVRIGSESILEGQKIEQKPLKIEEKVNLAIEFLNSLFENINIQAEIRTRESEKAIILDVKTEKASILIGHKGETLQALQTILGSYLRNLDIKGKKIFIDIEDYRKNQLKKVEEKAKKAIEKCLQTAKPVSLDFMNAYERFIVHDIVSEDARVTSESFGKEPRRFVKIFIK